MILRSRLDSAPDVAAPAAARWYRMTNFQRAMYRWSTIHPYYAVNIDEVDGPLDVDRLRTAAKDALAHSGMGGVQVDATERYFRFVRGPGDVDVARVDLPAADNPNVQLETWISEELNRPMARDGRFPLRIRACEWGGRYILLHLFDHWIGDGWILCCILDEILRRYLGRTSKVPSPRFGPDAVDVRNVLRGEFRLTRMAALVAESIRTLLAMRSCHSPSLGDKTNLAAAIRIPRFPEDSLRRILPYARAHDASVNDVLLALVLDAVDAVTQDRFHQRRRRHLAVVGISSLRPLAADRFDGKSGLYLGYFQVYLRGRRPQQFPELIGEVKAQTRRLKKTRTDLRGELEQGVCQGMWRWLSPAERLRQTQNNNPVAAGISNARFPDGCFPPDLFPPLRNVIGAASPGPATPLVVHATTVNDRMAFSVSWRKSAYSSDDVETIIESIRRRIENF